MFTSWSLMAFTTLMCVAAGTMGFQSQLALREKGEGLAGPSLAIAGASLVLGLVALLAPVQHIERLFKVFGNLGSTVTQVLLAAVALLAIVVVWGVLMYRNGEAPRALAVVSLAVSVLAVVALARFHQTPTRVGLSWAMLVLYAGNALLLGALAVALVAGCGGPAVGHPQAVRRSGAVGSLIGAVVELVGTAVVVVLAGLAKRQTTATSGVVFDPTHPTVGSKAAVADANMALDLLQGDAAPLFWCGVTLLAAVAVLAAVLIRRAQTQDANGRPTASTFAITGCALALALASSVLLRLSVFQACFSNVGLF